MRTPTRLHTSPAGIPAALATLCMLAPIHAGASVTAPLSPANHVVAPDSSFTIDLQVSVAGSPFNAFKAVVEYDPAVLTFQPGVPSSTQLGCLMTGACSGACGLTFHTFSAAGDSLVVDASLLCDQVSLTGPGTLYRFRFRAPTTPDTTMVRVRRLQFYQAGLTVSPVITGDTQVEIREPVSVAAALPNPGLRLSAEPNPARGALSLAIESDAPGEQDVHVLDVAGRLVRVLDHARVVPGRRTLRWDGTDREGRPLPAGVYLVRVTDGTRVAGARVVFLR